MLSAFKITQWRKQGQISMKKRAILKPIKTGIDVRLYIPAKYVFWLKHVLMPGKLLQPLK